MINNNAQDTINFEIIIKIINNNITDDSWMINIITDR